MLAIILVLGMIAICILDDLDKILLFFVVLFSPITHIPKTNSERTEQTEE